MQKIICVTGPMAAGKNAASSILEKKGFAVIDADVTAHEVLSDPAMQARIIETFSAAAAQRQINLINNDGSLNRRALGALIFHDPELLAHHESLIHPVINSRLEDFITAHAGQNIVLNATVLYKVAIINKCTSVLYVDAPFFIRFLRAKKRDTMKTSQIISRFCSQKQLFAKYRAIHADIYRVRNIGKIQSLERKINRFLSVCR